MRRVLFVALLILLASGFGRALALQQFSVWSDVPDGVIVEQVTTGTYDDVLTISRLIAITHVDASPGGGVMSFFNTNPGMVGPRIVYAPSGHIEVGPYDVSPGSSPGPSMLFGESTDQSPMIVMPGTQLPLIAGDYMYFPADTSFHLNSDQGNSDSIYYEIDMFPGAFQLSDPNEVGVSDFILNSVIPDLGVDIVGATQMDFIAFDRVTIVPEQGPFEHTTKVSPQILLIQTGALAIPTTNSNLQILRAGENSPGHFTTTVEPVLLASDAVFLPPGAEVELATASTEPTTIFAITVNPVAVE